jgi:paraquat-inducible protein A
MHLPARAPGEAARCPRCGHHVAGTAQRDAQRLLAWALATLIVLALVFVFNFMSFSVHGISHSMGFVDTARALIGYHYPIVAGLLVATTVGLPGVYLLALVYLSTGIELGRRLPGALGIARSLRLLEEWLMPDTFVVGVLVGLIKIIQLANIHLAASFAVFCLYALLFLRTLALVDWISLWDRLARPVALDPLAITGRTGRSQRLVACRGCDSPFHDNPRHRCPRCGKRHFLDAINRAQLTWALLVTATLLYIPANVYPILSITWLGRDHGQTIFGGVRNLAASGSWPIAAVVFTASIIIPVSKIAALAWLGLVTRFRWRADPRSLMRVYRIVAKIGRWSMIDVFVVSVLSALVDAGRLMSIQPDPAVLAFALVVIITMIAVQAFDPRRLWRE